MKLVLIAAGVVLCGTGTVIFQLFGSSAGPKSQRPRRGVAQVSDSSTPGADRLPPGREKGHPDPARRATAQSGRSGGDRKASPGDAHGPNDKETPTITQPGSVIPDKSADLYAKVSGYLDRLGEDLDGKPVDIGSRVKAGDVLAVIAMPELDKEVQRDRAALARAKTVVDQMKARITTAKADFRAAVKMTEFRTKVYKRLDELAKVEDAIDMRVVDEKEEQMHAAEETKNAAEAKILQAEADLDEANAAVELAQATLERAEVDLAYATIKSPYDGIITVRNFWPGAFIKERGGENSVPLLAIEKTDVVRVVVMIPDTDVPFVHARNKATVTIDNLPRMKFEGEVSRIANAEDPHTRTMRVEIDLPNPHDYLRNGMYGDVTIELDKGNGWATTP